MGEWYVDAAGTGTNDGRDNVGHRLTSGGFSAGTYTDSNRRLTQTGKVTGYTWAAGDRIYLSAGAGITAGWYDVESVFDADDTIVLATSAGSDSTSDVVSSSGAYDDLQDAIDDAALAAGDVIYQSASTYVYTAQIDFNGTDGTVDAHIWVVGVDSNWVETGTDRPELQFDTMTGTGATTNNGIYFPSSTGMLGVAIRNFQITNDWNGTSGGNVSAVKTDAASVTVTLTNCLLQGWGESGACSSTGNGSMCLIDTEIDSCDDGFICDYVRGPMHMYGGSIHDCTGDAIIFAGYRNVFVGVLIHSNGADGITQVAGVTNTDVMLIVSNCSIYGTTGDGIDWYQASAWVTSTIIRGFTNGLNTNGNGAHALAYADYNSFSGNTNDIENGDDVPGFNNQNTDPDEDASWRPSSSWAGNGTGLFGTDIGAVQQTGGGGTTVVPGMVHNAVPVSIGVQAY